jgi:thioredoxin 1
MNALTRNNFSQEVLEADGPVLVDFSAEWCGPCKKLHPIIEELAVEYGERLKVGTVDVGVETDIASRYGVMSVPTMLFFKSGEVREKIIGLASKEKLKATIDRIA